MSNRNNLLYAFGRYRLDATKRRLFKDGEPITLPQQIFDLLLILVESPGRLKNREELIAALWPANNAEAQQGLTKKLHALRKTLGDDGATPKYIETVRGIGYRFIAEVTVEQATSSVTHRRYLHVGAAIIALGIVVGGLLVWRLGFYHSTDKDVFPNRPSIAVLPFANLSDDSQSAYFAAGMEHAIQTRLASLHGLKVIALSSAARYKTRPADLKLIGSALGVSTVLTGSVQKAGEYIKVNVQLVDTRSLDHIWAHDYTRKLTDVFEVETDISKAVASALGAALTRTELDTLAARPTDNPAAYDAYLRGLAYTARGGNTLENYGNAVKYFSAAVKLDSRFAQAWARLSMAHTNMYLFGYDHRPERMEKARKTAERAVELAPHLGIAWLARGQYFFVGLKDHGAARKAFETARRYLPNNAEVLNALGYLQRDLGHWDKALLLQQQAAAIDPLNARTLFQWGLTYVPLRRFAQARALFERALNIAPGDVEVIAIMAASYQAEGNLAAAGKILAKLPTLPGDFRPICVKADQLLFQRDYAKAIALLESAIAEAGPAEGDAIGYYYTLLGLALLRSGDAQGAHNVYLAGRAALHALRKTGDDSFWLLAALGHMEAGLGHADAARDLARQAIHAARGIHTYEPSMLENLARTEAQLGDVDAALALLPRLLKTHYGRYLDAMPLTRPLLKLNPAWDPLRKDPRFQALLQQSEETSSADKRLQ